MKRIVTSLGVAALGAACVQPSSAQAIGGDASKPWSASVALRGFYDDNVRSVNGALNKVDTFGFNVEPSLGFAFPFDQTTLSLEYTFSYKYYDEKPDPMSTSHDDMTHTIAARMIHSFSERTSLAVSDSFVIGQEPDVLRAGNFTSAYQSISGDNIRNYGSISVNHQFAPKLGVEVGYANSLYDYADDLGDLLAAFGATSVFLPPPPAAPVGLLGLSRSAVLDRMEHDIHVDLRYNVASTTVALLGYQFSMARYTADEPVGIVSGAPIYSDVRDSDSHYVYAGIEHSFRSDLTGSVRVGARFNDYFNSPNDESGVSPYVAASLRYIYAQDCSLQVGVSHDRNATDLFSVVGDSITTDAESTVVYGSITHKIVADLYGTVMAQYQHSDLNGGYYDSSSDDYLLASVGLEYRINRHVSATASYHYDMLDSNVPLRSFDRNRFYLGAVVSY